MFTFYNVQFLYEILRVVQIINIGLDCSIFQQKCSFILSMLSHIVCFKQELSPKKIRISECALKTLLIKKEKKCNFILFGNN